MKLNEKEKKRNTVSLFGVHRIRSGRARKTCYMSSPVFRLERYQRLRWSRKELQSRKTKDVNLDFRGFKCQLHHLCLLSIPQCHGQPGCSDNERKKNSWSLLKYKHIQSIRYIFSILLPLKIYIITSHGHYILYQIDCSQSFVFNFRYYWKNTKKLGCLNERETTMVGHV